MTVFFAAVSARRRCRSDPFLVAIGLALTSCRLSQKRLAPGRNRTRPGSLRGGRKYHAGEILYLSDALIREMVTPRDVLEAVVGEDFGSSRPGNIVLAYARMPPMPGSSVPLGPKAAILRSSRGWRTRRAIASTERLGQRRRSPRRPG